MRGNMTNPQAITSNIDLLLETLPIYIQQSLYQGPDDKEDLLEIIMDLGRLPEARYRGHERFLSDHEVTQEDIDYVIARIGAFGEDNRAGIPRTLHRISAMRNRVVIVDTSNEIAGDGDIPHPGIGRARRMQVPRPSEQHAVMIEAVENHMPEVIVIDEIGPELETLAARSIAERGVQLIGTAHGIQLENLLSNPTLSDLIGGIQAVTLGDEEARRRGTQKTVLERKAPPTFDVLVEIQSWDRVSVYSDVASAVDSILRGEEPLAELRSRDVDGQVTIEAGSLLPRNDGSDGGTYVGRRHGDGGRGGDGWQRHSDGGRG